MVARNRGIRLQLCPRAAVSPSAQRTRFTSQSLPGLPLRGDSRSSGCTARRDYPWERRVLDPMDSSSVDGSLAEERTGSGSDAAPPTRTERNHDDEHRDGHGDDRTDSALSARRVHKRRRVAAGAGGCGGRLASSRATGGRTRSAEASARTKIEDEDVPPVGAEATIVRRVSRWRVARLHGSYRVWLGCNCQCSVAEQRRPASWGACVLSSSLRAANLSFPSPGPVPTCPASPSPSEQRALRHPLRRPPRDSYSLHPSIAPFPQPRSSHRFAFAPFHH